TPVASLVFVRRVQASLRVGILTVLRIKGGQQEARSRRNHGAESSVPLRGIVQVGIAEVIGGRVAIPLEGNIAKVILYRCARGLVRDAATDFYSLHHLEIDRHRIQAVAGIYPLRARRVALVFSWRSSQTIPCGLGQTAERVPALGVGSRPALAGSHPHTPL